MMHSPVLEATWPIALNLEADSDESTLNPNAPAFVPSWQNAPSREMSTTSSSSSFHPSESGQWVTHGTYTYQWAAPGGEDYYVDETVGYCLDHEDVMRAHLHKPPQKPKGKTQGRARGGGHYHGNARWAHA